MNYRTTELKEVFSIKNIISIHYFEYMSNFSFPGEFHNFWEFLCVDKGVVEVTSNHETFLLKRGDIIFHQPNEFHALSANGIIAPNLLVVSFECENKSMEFFRKKRLTIGENERGILAQIIIEAKHCFSGVLDDPYLEKLTPVADPPFGSSQMIKLNLELLLIQLYRNFSYYHHIKEKAENEPNSHIIYKDIISYFERSIRLQLTIEGICRDNLISDSYLKKLFRERHNSGVIQYFTKMKIDMAKQLIRNRQMNFTQIADYLGYTSIHYFSRQFKKQTGMTPSEYTASIKQRTEGGRL